MDTVFAPDTLVDFASALFEKVTFERDKARSTAGSLVRADMMGHSTHGLALAPWYVAEAADGGVRGSGSPAVLSDKGGVVSWDGRQLPGGWLVERALHLASERVRAQGVVTVSIGNAFHTGALAAHLPDVAARDLMAVVSCSDPSAQAVAPHGGQDAVFTPNPFAAVIPTHGTPTIVDISASITTMNQTRQLAAAGLRFPFEAAVDRAGRPTMDPRALADGNGALLPVGGDTHGHKGFGLGLVIEALTQSLTGRGRDKPVRGTALNIFVQMLDPDAFGGTGSFKDAATHLAEACRASAPRPGFEDVRVPGDRAMAELRRTTGEGVGLRSSVVESLREVGDRYDLSLPTPISAADRSPERT